MTDFIRISRGSAFAALAFLGMATALPAQAQQYTFQPLLSFDYNSIGANPMGALTLDNGSLYGTASVGGGSGLGTVFRYDLAAGGITASADFGQTNGATPMAGLTAYNGALYGTASNGGDANSDGVVFEYDPTANAIFNPVALSGAGSGSAPSGTLTSLNGKLYGTAQTGGANGAGTVFEFTPGAGGSPGAFTAVTGLTSGTTGGGPLAGLAAYNGKLYGTAVSGGSGGAGGVFEYTPGGGGFTSATSFVTTNGASPESGLSLYNGNFYGTTQAGGVGGFGTIFQYSPTSHAITNLFSFADTNGSEPTGDLVSDGSGTLYGTTSTGGSGGDGTVFAFNAATNKLTTLVNFDDSAFPGNSPNAGLVFAGGSLFGTTTYGGATGDGTLFELVAPAAAPEPSGAVALALGLLGLGALRMRARRRAEA